MTRRAKLIVYFMWVAVVVGVVCVARCHAQTTTWVAPMGTNALVASTNAAYFLIHTANGDITIPLSAAVGSFLATIAGLAWVARIALRFLPSAQSGTALSWLVGFLKVLGATTPQKHQGDVSVSAPTPNGLNNPPPQTGTNIIP